MKTLLIIINIIITMSSINTQESIYDIKIKNIYGENIDLYKYQGKYILFVNVASKCGFTSQYKELEELFQNYKDKLVIIGIPCNQFGGQEPGTQKEIINFCKNNYGVSFILTEKVDVKGPERHPLYDWLCDKERNGRLDSKVRWNFQKYLVNKNGEIINYYYSNTSPMNKNITKNIK
tara:strand:- start:47 stop:577 length:531 start_codon:yes stop_codon:yes gene_type:complete